MHAAPELLNRLSAEVGFLRRRRWLLSLLGAALAVAIPLLLVAVVDSRRPLQEQTAALWLAAGLLVAAGIAVMCFRRQCRADRRAVALAIERAHPELMDALICAVETAESETPPGPLVKALQAKVSTTLAELDVHGAAARLTLSSALLSAIAVLTLAALGLLAPSALVRKAAAHLTDRWHGTASGLTVTPGDTEVAGGDDLAIGVTVHRGPDNADIVLIDGDGRELYTMIAKGAGQHVFELFNVTAPLHYQIRTPTLTSPVFEIRTFAKPAILHSTVTARPPAYTGRPAVHLDELKDLSLPQGTQLTLGLETNLPVAAEFLPEEGEAGSFQPGTGPTSLTYACRVDASVRYRLALIDEQGHRILTNRLYSIECIEDLPPVIQVQAPDEDAKHRPDDLAAFSVRTTDDYGVAEVMLYVAINGGKWAPVVLREAPAANATESQREVDSVYALDLEGLVRAGDLVSYYIAAHDNAQPESHGAQTDLRFIEIRPEIPPEPDTDAEGQGQQQETLKVSDLIVEQKRLIRQTWRARQMPEEDGLVTDLVKAANDLRVIAQKRYSELKKATGDAYLGPVDDLFQEVLEHMGQAEKRLQMNLLDESLPPQQRSLARLIALEIELQKNAVKAKGQGQGESSESPPEQNQREANESRDRREALEQLQQQINRMEDLVRRQTELNRDIQSPRAAEDADYRRFLAQRQEGVRKDTDEVRTSMRELTEGFEIQGQLHQAGNNMAAATANLGQGRAGNAAKHGELAQRFLERSQLLMRQLHDALSGNELAQAERMLEALQQQQQALQRATGQAGGDRGKTRQLMQGQERLKDQAERFMNELAGAAAEMEEQNPRAAEQVHKGLQQADTDNLLGKMSRAANALRYGRGDRAGDYQGQVLESMSALQEQLQQAMKQGPPLTNEQLTNMLRRTLSHLEEMQKSAENGGQAKDEQLSRASQDLDDMASRLGDPAFDQAAGAMRNLLRLGDSGPSAATTRQAASLLAQTARLLEQRLFELAIRQKLDLSRAVGQQAPDAYRKLVSEYFKNLSRTE